MARSVDDLALRVAFRAHDPEEAEITHEGYIGFINDAMDDLTAAGWLVQLAEDITTTLAVATFSYVIPAAFAYIRKLVVADGAGEYPNENEIPQMQWFPRLNSDGEAILYFAPDGWDVFLSGRTVRMTGQGRPAVGLNGSSIVPGGMETFVRERATAYALEYLGEGESELAQSRIRRSQMLMQTSQAALGSSPMEFRVKSDSVHVPGR